MSEMRSTCGAYYLSPAHPMRTILPKHYCSWKCLIKTRPSGSRIKFCTRRKEYCATRSTTIHTFSFFMEQCSRKWRFSPFSPQYVILLRSQLFAPLFFGAFTIRLHGYSIHTLYAYCSKTDSRKRAACPVSIAYCGSSDTHDCFV